MTVDRIGLGGVGLERPVVILLSGPPASGKLTIGRAVVARLGPKALLLDNHGFSDPILALVSADGDQPLPPVVWDYVTRIKSIVLEAATELVAPDASFVFTNYLDPHDGASVARAESFAGTRGAVFIPVALHCPAEELVRRVGNEDRGARRKLRSPEILRQLLSRGVLIPQHRHLLELDSANHDPSQLAEAIVRHSLRLASD